MTKSSLIVIALVLFVGFSEASAQKPKKASTPQKTEPSLSRTIGQFITEFNVGGDRIPARIIMPSGKVANNMTALEFFTDFKAHLPSFFAQALAAGLNYSELEQKYMATLLDELVGGRSEARISLLLKNLQDAETKRLENQATKDEEFAKDSKAHKDRIRDAVLALLRKLAEIKGNY